MKLFETRDTTGKQVTIDLDSVTCFRDYSIGTEVNLGTTTLTLNNLYNEFNKVMLDHEASKEDRLREAMKLQEETLNIFRPHPVNLDYEFENDSNTSTTEQGENREL